ncbi:MAG: NBR1-Ig-like domain-containing protein [Anaerolineales bacterium]
MRYTKSSLLMIVLALALVLSACNFGQEPEPTPDIGVIFTAAAETVVAEFSLQQTQTALAAPTATPQPTNTTVATFAVVSPGAGSPTAPSLSVATAGPGTQPAVIATIPTATSIGALATQAGSVCMNSAFVADVTYPDGSVVKAGEWIIKTWSIQNTGECTWDDGFGLVQYSGDMQESEKWEITQKKDFVDPNEIIEISLQMKVPGVAGEHGGCWRMRGDSDYYFGTSLCVLVKAE